MYVGVEGGGACVDCRMGVRAGGFRPAGQAGVWGLGGVVCMRLGRCSLAAMPRPASDRLYLRLRKEAIRPAPPRPAQAAHIAQLSLVYAHTLHPVHVCSCATPSTGRSDVPQPNHVLAYNPHKPLNDQ